MKLVYFGPLWTGGTALQRAASFEQTRASKVLRLDVSNGIRDQKLSLYERVRWRLGWPVDSFGENRRILDAAKTERPDVLLVDNSKVLHREVLLDVKQHVGALVYYSPDDMLAPHFMKEPLRRSLDVWDIIFTTKTYNVEELRALGVKRPILAGNAYDPGLHRPMSAEEVGVEFEKYDVVFVGAFERERFRSLLALAKAGLSVLVHGVPARLSGNGWAVAHPNLTLRRPAYAEDYARVLHHGKIALCFLRKINRDRITTRSIEIPAMERPMLAEKTEEHDSHFVDGLEYQGFENDADMTEKARALLACSDRRQSIALAGRKRCEASGYSTFARARQMIDEIKDAAFCK
jgi:spore maturation protein CgeB